MNIFHEWKGLKSQKLHYFKKLLNTNKNINEKIFSINYKNIYQHNIISLFLLVFIDRNFSSMNTEEITNKN